MLARSRREDVASPTQINSARSLSWHSIVTGIFVLCAESMKSSARNPTIDYLAQFLLSHCHTAILRGNNGSARSMHKRACRHNMVRHAALRLLAVGSPLAIYTLEEVLASEMDAGTRLSPLRGFTSPHLLCPTVASVHTCSLAFLARSYLKAPWVFVFCKHPQHTFDLDPSQLQTSPPVANKTSSQHHGHRP